MASRPLSSRERDILTYLLAVEAPWIEELQTQAESALASPWDCTCASIDLIVDRDGTRQSAAPAGPAIEAVTREREPERLLELLLWVEDGWLSGIEVVGYLDRHEDAPDVIPPPTDFDRPRARTV